jgi:hypothetical protein
VGDERKKCCAERECLVTAYCSFFVGGGLGKAGKNPAYFSLAATAATSNIHPFIHPSKDSIESVPIVRYPD